MSAARGLIWRGQRSGCRRRRVPRPGGAPVSSEPWATSAACGNSWLTGSAQRTFFSRTLPRDFEDGDRVRPHGDLRREITRSISRARARSVACSIACSTRIRRHLTAGGGAASCADRNWNTRSTASGPPDGRENVQAFIWCFTQSRTSGSTTVVPRLLDRRIVAIADVHGVGEDRLRPAYAEDNTAAREGQVDDLDRLSIVRGAAFDRQFWVTLARDHRAASTLLSATSGTVPSRSFPRRPVCSINPFAERSRYKRSRPPCPYAEVRAAIVRGSGRTPRQ